MSRIRPLPAKEAGPVARLGYAYSRREFGQVPDPVGVFAHHPKLLAGYGALEAAAERANRVDVRLKGLAELKAAMVAGCEYCIDIGSAVVAKHGVPADQVRDLARHADSDGFNDLERLVLDYAVGMTSTPIDVPDDLFARLREHFDEAQIVELTSAIALENFRARFNWALEIAPQGFATECAVPEPAKA
jgi:AhpD family alkylhydroperoxidase